MSGDMERPMLTRRGILGALLAAPAIIRTPGLIMPVRKVVVPAPPIFVSVGTTFMGAIEPGMTLVIDMGGTPREFTIKHVLPGGHAFLSPHAREGADG